MRFCRRTFLKTAGAAAAAGCLAPLAPGLGIEEQPKARVVIAQAGKLAGTARDPSDETVRTLVDKAVAGLTESAGPDTAWKSLFSSSDRVAVKVNTLAGPQLSTHPSVVRAIVGGLLSAGVLPANVVVFDRSHREMKKAGFPEGKDKDGIAYAATDDSDVGYDPRIITSGSVGSLWSRVITNFATAIVNVPVLKDHDLSGVSLGMKNFFGVIHNPNKYHDNGCDPYIADLCRHELIRNKLRLVVIDALRAQADGGPAYSEGGAYAYCGVIAGVDPVATDRAGWAEIESVRARMGFKTLEAVGRKPAHILTAAAAGLGIGQLEKIAVVRLAV